MTMMTAIQDIFFADQGLVDNRQALFSFVIPGCEGEWGFFPPTATPWKVLAVVSCRHRVRRLYRRILLVSPRSFQSRH
jgi:hypothetical protein